MRAKAQGLDLFGERDFLGGMLTGFAFFVQTELVEAFGSLALSFLVQPWWCLQRRAVFEATHNRPDDGMLAVSMLSLLVVVRCRHKCDCYSPPDKLKNE